MENVASTAGSPQLYRHSGRVPAKAFMLGTLAALGAGAIYGSVFGFLELYGHLIPFGKLMFLALFLGTLGLGFALGETIGRILEKFKARSIKTAFGLSSLSALMALYWAWEFYFVALIQYGGGHPSPMFIARPDILYVLFQNAYEKGVWSFGDVSPSGIFFVMIWLVEAGIILGLAVKVAQKRINKKVFCEQCDRWGESKHLMQLQDAGYDGVKRDLAEGRLESLCAAKERTVQRSWMDVTLEGCPDCDNLQTLTVERTVVNVDNKGKSTTKSMPLVRRMILNSEQSMAVIQAAAALRMPPAESNSNVEGDSAKAEGQKAVPESDAQGAPDLGNREEKVAD